MAFEVEDVHGTLNQTHQRLPDFGLRGSLLINVAVGFSRSFLNASKAACSRSDRGATGALSLDSGFVEPSRNQSLSRGPTDVPPPW
jgi:hypothetical protein